MEEEIDLRRYIVVLLKYRYWIAGLVIATALVSLCVSLVISPIYEATALVTVTQPRYQLQFDSRFQDVPEWYITQFLQSQYRAYPDLASSDELFQQLAKETNWSLKELQENLRVEAKEDPSLLTLTVRGKNAEETALIANTWAKNFVAFVNDLYGAPDASKKFEKQLIQASQSLTQANAALTAFRAENGFGFDRDGNTTTNSNNLVISDERIFKGQFGLIGQRLQTKNNLLTDYEAELARLRQMQHEVELLSTTTTAETSPVVVAGLLSEMIDLGLVEDKIQPYQIQLPSVDPAAALAAMAKALKARTTAIEAEIKKLQSDITTIQVELATKQNQLEQLTREQVIAAETYQVIARKVQETRLDPVSDRANVKIAGQAIAPIEPVFPKLLLNTAIAGALGLLIGIFGVFAWEWWRSGQVKSGQSQSKVVLPLSPSSSPGD